MKPKKSEDYYVDLPDAFTADQMHIIVSEAAKKTGLHISHIGGYSRTKYPNSVHWHFKRDPREPGLLDATFWDIKSLFWLMIRHREPDWVQEIVPKFLQNLQQQVRKMARQLTGQQGVLRRV